MAATPPPVPTWSDHPLPAPEQIGRPAGLAVTKDGALLVGDDANGVIYRVSYGVPKSS